MATKAQLQKALDEVWDKYGNVLASLNDALDELDKKPKEIEVMIEVEKIIPDKKKEKALRDEIKLLKADIKDLEEQLEFVNEQYHNEKDKQPVVKEVEVIKEVDVIVEKEVPVEVEKIIEVEKEVPVEKETVVTVQVPGPERIVEVPGPERIVEKIVEVEKTVIDVEAEAQLQIKVKELENTIKMLKKRKQTKVIKQVPVEVAVPTENDLQHTARLLVDSELNKEDLTEQELVALLQRSSEEDVQKQIGFWATNLPNQDDAQIESHYIGKK